MTGRGPTIQGEAYVGEPLAAGVGFGGQALVSNGPGGARCELDAGQLRLLEAVLDAGQATVGWPDQCWSLARIAAVVRRRFGVEYTWPGWTCCCTASAGACRSPKRTGCDCGSVIDRSSARIAGSAIRRCNSAQ